MSERKPGYYMVRYNHDGSPWEPAEWDGERWMLIGNGGSFSPSKIGEVGPRIPTPDEPWQCVPKYEPTEAMLFKAEVEAKSKEVDMGSPWPTEHPNDGGGVAGAYYRGLLAAAPSPNEN